MSKLEDSGASPPKKTKMTEKVFNDPIHGHIELPELCVSIIDTPQFQRLRYIKQLGGAYFVYPGASHNRFEHSIGVCHLAGELTKKLQNSQPELEIAKKDVLCVMIAGLCHDLGHGPFSHLFDKYFIPLFDGVKWKHETGSVDMFHHMLQENPKLKEQFEKEKLDDDDITFITELIISDDDSAPKGRPETKSFLYEIVNNARTGVDVDKWDYFARDCHHLGMKNAFDHNRLIKFARVLKVDGKYQLCTRDKEVLNLYDMFYTRTLLHRRAYQHKTTVIIEHMIAEAFKAADEFFTVEIPGETASSDCERIQLSKTIHNMKAFSQLDDSIFREILHSTRKELEPARAILQRVESRKHYRIIGEYKMKDETKPSKQHPDKKYEDDKIQQVKELKTKIEEEIERKKHPGLTKDDIVILDAMFSYGKKGRNPVREFYLYSKTEPEKAFKMNEDEVSKMLPTQFREFVIRVYCKNIDIEVCKIATQCFEEARKSMQCKDQTPSTSN